MKQCADYKSFLRGNISLQSQLSNEKHVVDQLAFPSLEDFSAAVTADAIKWTDFEQNVFYQIVNTRTDNTQHGQSIILSLQKADGCTCSAWDSDMRTTELLQNPMIMESSRMFVLATGKKTSKNGRIYNSYQLLQF